MIPLSHGRQYSIKKTQHTGDVVGLQAWADGRTKTNVAQKNIHTLFFLVIGGLQVTSILPVLAQRQHSGICKLELKYHYRKNLDNTAKCHCWLEISETNKSKVY